MVNQLNVQLLSAYRYASRAASGVVILISLLVLAGWLFHIPALTSILPGLATMKANSALAFLLAGVSLWLAQPTGEKHKGEWISEVCAAATALIGVLTLSQYVFGKDLGIDQLLIQDTLSPETSFPGRMSPVTSLNLSMLGFALFLMARHLFRWLVELLGLGVLLLSVLALIGYAYGFPSLYDFSPYSAIALHTAFSFSILSLGILFAQPEQGLMKLFSSDDLGGAMARRLMPAAILIPFVLGWLFLTGQRMGLYDSTFRLALSAVTTVLVFGILIVWNASLLRNIDLVRQQTQKELHASRKAEWDLQKAKLELEAANKELEAFSYSVSHDLRSPLRSIDGYSLALLEDFGELLPGEGRRFLENVRGSAQRMGELIDDLLKLSQVSRAEIHAVPVDLTRLAERILTEFQRNHPERTIRFRITPNLNAHGDARLLQVVLENLLNNAWKYTSRQEQAEIEFGARQEDGRTIFFVHDNGAGFDMAYAGKLFGAFQRLHGMTEFPGTGIGLATVQRIIHRHGGRIWAEGVVDGGATFFFTLPDPEGAEAAIEIELPEEVSILQRAREII
ncbi:MAG TPA: ATP-binding protein [Anaerolineales bacterium]